MLLITEPLGLSSVPLCRTHQKFVIALSWKVDTDKIKIPKDLTDFFLQKEAFVHAQAPGGRNLAHREIPLREHGWSGHCTLADFAKDQSYSSAPWLSVSLVLSDKLYIFTEWESKLLTTKSKSFLCYER